MMVKLLSYSREDFTMPIDQDVTIGKTYFVVDAFVEYDNKIYHRIIDDVSQEHLVLTTDCEQIDKQFTITTDCYCDVSGWTDEEVQQAAEIFKDAVEGSVIGDLSMFGGYHYLMFESGVDSIYVGSASGLAEHNRKTQLTKEDVFKGMDKSDDEVIWDGVGELKAGHVLMVRGTPAGSICRAVIDYIDKVRCVWHWEGQSNTIHNLVKDMEFKPIKTQAEKEIEEMIENIHQCYDCESFATTHPREYVKDAVIQLYNLGYRKTQ